jgi:hypothetical protein
MLQLPPVLASSHLSQRRLRWNCAVRHLDRIFLSQLPSLLLPQSERSAIPDFNPRLQGSGYK